ncbi:MAG: LamG domain-containing protein [Candidatus Delongbacteria bacterium]|nr:LamG domain-containing protein [Candidatus Delongbacteria bacterium]MBN2834592.1 LamG domain-containing protein [Candidatus Delongbacteria bacterium]
MSKKGLSLIVAIMITFIMLISISGAIAVVNNQRNQIFNDLNDTKLSFLAEGGMNLALNWLKEQKRSYELTLTKFPLSGDEKIYTIDGCDVSVSGIKDNTSKEWTFISKAAINGRTCEVKTTNVVPAIPLNDGNGLEFDGLDGSNGSRILIENTTDYNVGDTDQLTIMCWVKTAQASANTIGTGTKYQWSNIVSNVNPNSPASDCQFMLQHDSQNEYVEFALKNKNGNQRKYIMGNRKMNPDRWYHIVATYDNSMMKVYINEDYARWSYKYNDPKIVNSGKWFMAYDVVVENENGCDTAEEALNNKNTHYKKAENYEADFKNFYNTGILSPTTYVTNIGSTSGSSGTEGWRNYKGRIDDVSIWNRALTEDEIARYRIGTDRITGKEENLQAYWDFDDIGNYPSGSSIPAGTAIKNKKMILNEDGEWVYDASLDGQTQGEIKVITNSGENRDDDSSNKLVGELKRNWNVKFY